MSRKLLSFITLSLVVLTFASPVYAAPADVAKVETFIRSIISVLVTLAGLTAAGFFVWGGIGYISSSGNPETLDRSKKTIMYSAIGLAVVLGAFVLTNIVSDLSTQAFGASQ
ncbi:MAG: hypothetical protein ACD_22C00092G0019 [uncultured bacterium]|nr:MAG: hypothetical protein ACD_22C00092G0019 [uncultured bacterium]